MTTRKSKSQDELSDQKTISFKAPRKTWILLKKEALIRDCTIATIVLDLIEKNRNKITANFESLEARESI